MKFNVTGSNFDVERCVHCVVSLLTKETSEENTMKPILFSITAACAIFSVTAFAQTPDLTLSGTYVFAEEGTGVSQPVASLGILNFLSGGTVAGVHVLRSPGSTVKNNVQGTYALNPGGDGTLMLSYQSPGSDDNQPVTTYLKYNLRWIKNRGIVALRTDAGLFSLATLTPAAEPGPIKGGFLFAERANGAPYAGLGYLGLEGGNIVNGSEQIAALGSNGIMILTGTYSVGADGFGSLTLNTPVYDGFGSVTTATANYVFAAAANQIYAIRTDGASAFVSTLTPVQ
jgi:hypothetical protein